MSSSIQYSIRKAVVSDIPALTKMRWDHIMGYAEFSQRPVVDRNLFNQACDNFLRNALATGQWVVFIAEHEKQLIGHLYIQIIHKIPKPYELQGSWGYVTNTYVEEPYRNQEIGKKLLDAVKEWGQKNNLELLLLWPSEKSVDFYRRNGFSADTRCMQYTFKED
jgi:GNAT superfamily N-acetyltransferase